MLFTRRIFLVLVVVYLAPLFFSSTFAQTFDKQEKIIKKISFRNEPIEFLSIKSDNDTIDDGQIFRRQGDWLQSLEFKVRNTYSKPITYFDRIEVSRNCRSSATSSSFCKLWDKSFGCYEADGESRDS